ncbi:MAG: hypothetical protein ACLT5P_06655 [Flavonifractor plautii]
MVTLTKDVALLENGETSIREVVTTTAGPASYRILRTAPSAWCASSATPCSRSCGGARRQAGKGRRPLRTAKRGGRGGGLTADHYTPLGEFYPTVGYDTEIIYMWVATGLHTTQMHLDDDEFLTPDPSRWQKPTRWS